MGGPPLRDHPAGRGHQPVERALPNPGDNAGQQHPSATAEGVSLNLHSTHIQHTKHSTFNTLIQHTYNKHSTNIHHATHNQQTLKIQQTPNRHSSNIQRKTFNKHSTRIHQTFNTHTHTSTFKHSTRTQQTFNKHSANIQH